MSTEIEQPKGRLLARMAGKFGVDQGKLLETLKNTAFRQKNGPGVTNEQMMALLVVADQYGLNPFTKEIYAFPDKQNGIVPVVGVDGWSRIINSHPPLGLFYGSVIFPASISARSCHCRISGNLPPSRLPHLWTACRVTGEPACSVHHFASSSSLFAPTRAIILSFVIVSMSPFYIVEINIAT